MPASYDPELPIRNRLLAALPVEDYQRLLPKLEAVHLGTKQLLYKPNDPIAHIYFPQNCVVSLLLRMADDTTVEVATVGNEGIVGLPAYLGADKTTKLALTQVPGDALRIDADAFRPEMIGGSPLYSILQHYTDALLTSMAQTTACERIHSIEQRCARWLLMTCDRVGDGQFQLTQEFLSQTLGVRRATVTAAAGALQKAGWIRYTRGKIAIVDRDGLEAAACECYRIVRAAFDRLLRR